MKRNRITLSVAAMIAISTLPVTLPATGHEDATGVVKERMESMKTMRRSVKGLRHALRAGAGLDVGQVTALAGAISEEARRLSGLFPEGSHGKPSEALPKIWKSWTDFEARLKMTTDLASAVSRSAEAGDGSGAQSAFNALRKACNDCHERYQAED